MDVMFIRHAQPAWVVDGLGVLDPELTPKGHDQSRHLAEAARGWRRRPVQLVVSGARRARQTAEPLAEVLGLEPTVVPDLEEIRLPAEWEGKPALEIRAAFGDARARAAEEWWAGVPDGEPYQVFHDRVTGALRTLLAEHGVTQTQKEPPTWTTGDLDPETRIVIVAHGGTNSACIGDLLGLPPVPWSWERLVIPHTGISRVRAAPLLGAQIFGLRVHSDDGHVPTELRSR